jgi:hypothetical protein
MGRQRAAGEEARPLGNRPILAELPPPAPIESFRSEDVEYLESLGGLLKYYRRKAA